MIGFVVLLIIVLYGWMNQYIIEVTHEASSVLILDCCYAKELEPNNMNNYGGPMTSHELRCIWVPQEEISRTIHSSHDTECLEVWLIAIGLLELRGDKENNLLPSHHSPY